MYFFVFVTFVIIFKFKFILIYLLHVLLVFKIKGIFGKKISTQKCVERGSFLYIYSIDIFFLCLKKIKLQVNYEF